MKRLLFLATAVWLASIASVVSRAQPAAPPRSASPLVASIKELMMDVVDPASDVIFESVSYESTAAGVVEIKPRTNDDWLNIRKAALLMAEAPNLLKQPGRRVAPLKQIPGLEGEPAGPEDLPPAEIQKLIDRDRAAFNRLAQGLQDAALVVLKAVDARDVDALFESGEALDQACENCHIKYWYPPNAKPDPAALSQRKK
jgi:hypothetical protein